MIKPKYYLIVFLFVSVLISLMFVHAEMNTLGEDIEQKVDQVEVVKKSIDDQKWDYLDEQWKIILSKSKTYSAINSFLIKVSFIFRVLLGEPYSFGLVFFLIFILWIYFFFWYKEVFSIFSAFSYGSSILLAFAFTVISAQLKIFRSISEIIFKILFYKTGIWSFISFIIIFSLFLIFFLLTKIIRQSQEHQNKKSDKEQEKLDRYVLHKSAEGIKEGLKD